MKQKNRRVFWVIAGIILACSFSVGSVNGAGVSRRDEPPEFIRAGISAAEPVLPGETAVFMGYVVYDQRFSLHWEGLEKYASPPFVMARYRVGAPRIAEGEEGLFYNIARFRMIISVPAAVTEFRQYALASLHLSYSYLAGDKRIARELVIPFPELVIVPARIEALLEKDAVRIGEENRLLLRIYHLSHLRVLNEYIGILKDEKAGEAEKSEVRRWLESLEVRHLLALNLEDPELKPFVVKQKSHGRSQEGNVVRSDYAYTFSIFELPGIRTLGPFSLWMIEKGGSVPQELSAGPYAVHVQTGLSPERSEFEWVKDPKSAGTMFPLWYAYPLFISGGCVAAAGFVMAAKSVYGWAMRSSSGERQQLVRRRSARVLRRDLVRMLVPAARVGDVSVVYAAAVREALWAYAAALRHDLAICPEAQSAAEVCAACAHRFGEAADERVREAVRTLELAHVSGEARFLPRHAVALLKCMRKK